MTITGTSAPASGGEHLVSHTIDMISAVNGDRHDLHGRQVGVGTLLSAALYDRILSIETRAFREIPPDIDETFWGPLSAAVRKEYRKKIPKFKFAEEKLLKDHNWDTLRSTVQENLISPRRIKNCLREAGAAHRISDIRINDRPIDTERFLTIWKTAHQMRERFTVLDLALLIGILPEQAEAIAVRAQRVFSAQHTGGSQLCLA